VLVIVLALLLKQKQCCDSAVATGSYVVLVLL
jgi:hypothetical protein